MVKKIGTSYIHIRTMRMHSEYLDSFKFNGRFKRTFKRLWERN
jgi:hypothetical protein